MKWGGDYTPKEGATGDEESAETPSEPTIEFKPIVELPKEEPQSTGEEEDKSIFQQRAKLYEYYKNEETKETEWKERGIGNLKINEMKDKKYRVIMRTEGTQRLLLNFVVFKEVTASNSGEKKITFSGADENLKPASFMVRFNKNENAEEFLNKIKEVVSSLK